MNNLQERILDIIQENYNTHTGTNEAELASSEDIAYLLDQEMVKLLDWVGNHCVPNFHMHQKWNSMGVTKYTSEQLKDLYKAEMNNVECG